MGAISDLLGLIAKGGVIMFPIYLCTIITVAIIIDCIVFFENYIVDEYRFLNAILNLIREGHGDKFLDQCQKFTNPL